MDLSIIVGALVAFFLLVIIMKGVRIVPQSECVVIERLGKYAKTLKGGFNLIVPIIEQPREIFWIRNGRVVLTGSIDLRETVLDVPEQAVITRDNVTINIDAVLYIQVTDPTKMTYEIQNLPIAVGQLTQTSLRNVIGEMDLDHTLASRDVINSKLKLVWMKLLLSGV
jgi:regulator of protease activity HflC (stomatin/prohibitin superfamily)